MKRHSTVFDKMTEMPVNCRIFPGWLLAAFGLITENNSFDKQLYRSDYTTNRGVIAEGL
jgi:hypothetical protein